MIILYPTGSEYNKAIATDRIPENVSLVVIVLPIQGVYLEQGILYAGVQDHVHPDKSPPLIMRFPHLYGLGELVPPSALVQIPEHLYHQ